MSAVIAVVGAVLVFIILPPQPTTTLDDELSQLVGEAATAVAPVGAAAHDRLKG